MGTKQIRRAFAVLVVALSLCLSGSQLTAQAGFRPTPCPPTVTQRLFGFLEFWHAGYKWPGTWELGIEYKSGEGYYRPTGGLSYVISLNGKAIWENAGIIVNCQAETWWDGFGFQVKIHYHLHQHLGKVRARCEGSGGSRSTEIIDDYGNVNYEPYHEDLNYIAAEYYIDQGNYSFTPLYSEADYSSFDSYGSCSDGSSGGNGGGSGGSGGGGSGGSNCRTEYVVIEISYDDGKTWSVYWEGEATVCE